MSPDAAPAGCDGEKGLDDKTCTNSTSRFRWALSELLKPVPDIAATASENVIGGLGGEPERVGSVADMEPSPRQHVTEEEFREFGYPPMPKEFMSEEYWTQQDELERTDPRVNPNLSLDGSEVDTNSQEFWDNAMRKPLAKYIQRHSDHRNQRRKVWLEQSGIVEEMNLSRENLADALESCSMEVKRLVTPIFRYKIMEHTLHRMLLDSAASKVPFEEFLERDDKLAELRTIRSRIDRGGPSAAKELMDEHENRVATCLCEEQLAKDKARKARGRIAMDAEILVDTINRGSKCKQDGMLEWQNGNFAEAFLSWKEADDWLRKYKSFDKSETNAILELHISVLKNLAQAAIKLESWTEALEAADAALAIDVEDHKAWFRRACALEGLGRFEETEKALDIIDELVVGSKDSKRVHKDTDLKRERLRSRRQQHQKMCKKGLERAFNRGLFCDDRDRPPPPAPLPEPPRVSGWRIDDKARRRLTKDGAEDLLLELQNVYADSTLRCQIDKLMYDVRHDREKFLLNMRGVTLDAQRPVLARWGFDADAKGVAEMQMALADHTRGKNADRNLKLLAEETIRVLYGPMYDIVMSPVKA